MGESTETWKALPLPWQVAFEEAWASFRAGSFGVGAVITDPAAENAIVTAGRNRVAQQQRSPRTLSGNMTAHAEMNAFAELDTFNAEGLHLYTTLEPCLMCAATAMSLKVAHVNFAARDEFYEGLDELWGKHSLTAGRRPSSTGPLDSPLAGFARLLPMIYTLEQFPERSAAALARQRHPGLAAIIDGLPDDPTFADIRKSGNAHRALGHLWPALQAISE
jgi:tRNA(Arg) A34 adenosine deaminase TadA